MVAGMFQFLHFLLFGDVFMRLLCAFPTSLRVCVCVYLCLATITVEPIWKF